MNKKKSTRVGSEVQYDPRTAGEILHHYLENSDDALAVAYREHMSETEAEKETDCLFKHIYPNTELGVDLKLVTRTPGRIPIGTYLDGMITRDGEEHFCFVQNDPEKKMATPRNPHVYMGKCINVNRKDDGTLYPTFNRPPYTESFTLQDFCRAAAEELCAVAGFVEKNPITE